MNYKKVVSTKIVTKHSFRKVPTTKLQSLAPAFIVMIVASLIIGIRAQADTTNFFTGCIRSNALHNLYNVQLGTTPTAQCNTGDHQVSADYGDITSVIAGTSLTGGATQGEATLSIANGGVNTAQLANAAVTAAKINSGNATSGQALTADGSGGASWQTSSGGGSSNQVPFIITTGNLDGITGFGDRFKGKNLTGAFIQKTGIGDTDASNVILDNATMQGNTAGINNVNFSGASFKDALVSYFFSSNSFVGANFTGATFTIYGNNPSIFTSNDFTNANFTNANLNGTTWTGNTLTGITWSNTTCADGTNSDNDGGTCGGHLNGQ